MRAKKLFKSALLAGAVASVLSIYSCGGGGGGGAEATSTVKVYGNVIDGYIFGGTVFADCNGDGKMSSDDPSGFTFGDVYADNDNEDHEDHIVDLDGDNDTIENYALEISSKCAGAKLYAMGGLDTSTQLPFGSVLIGIQGEYNNNITPVTSVIAASEDPEKTKKAVEKLLGKKIDVLYVENSIEPALFKFAVAVASSMQILTQWLGQVDIDTAEAIYRNLAKELNNEYDKLPSSTLSPDEIKRIVAGAVAKGLKDTEDGKNYSVDSESDLENAIKGLLDRILAGVDDTRTRYEDLGPYADNDSIIRIIQNEIIGSNTFMDGITAKKLSISKIEVQAEDNDSYDVGHNGYFDLEVDYTNGGTLHVVAEMNPADIGAGTKTVHITFAIKPEPRAEDRRSAVITFRDVEVTIDGSGNVTGLNTDDAFIIVDGTDTFGNRAGLNRTIALKNDLEDYTDILSLDGDNRIKIDIQKLLDLISEKAPAGHPLKSVQLKDPHGGAKTYRIGISVLGLPTQPVTGNLTLN